MPNKDTSFSIHMLGAEMNVINLGPNEFINLFYVLVGGYALYKLINLFIKYAENRLNLK